jgi:hypothetical protein
MAAIFDSAPECVLKDPGTEEARIEDSADFVMGDPYADCAGFMTFGPGSTYGEEGEAAEGIYMFITWLGIGFMLLALLAWVVYENRRLIAYAIGHHGFAGQPVPPQPGATDDRDDTRTG